MSLRVTCMRWFNAELSQARCPKAVLAVELCEAAYDILEAAAPLTHTQQQYMRLYMAKLRSRIKRVTSEYDSQSRIVWPSEETDILSVEDYSLIS